MDLLREFENNNPNWERNKCFDTSWIFRPCLELYIAFDLRPALPERASKPFITQYIMTSIHVHNIFLTCFFTKHHFLINLE
jgi:hypothetical protein